MDQRRKDSQSSSLQQICSSPLEGRALRVRAVSRRWTLRAPACPMIGHFLFFIGSVPRAASSRSRKCSGRESSRFWPKRDCSRTAEAIAMLSVCILFSSKPEGEWPPDCHHPHHEIAPSGQYHGRMPGKPEEQFLINIRARRLCPARSNRTKAAPVCTRRAGRTASRTPTARRACLHAQARRKRSGATWSRGCRMNEA